MDLTQRRLKLIFWISSRLFSKRKIFFTWFFFEFNYLQGGLKISLTMLGVQEKFISFRSTTNYNITNFKRSNVNSISLSLPFICLYFHKMIIKVFGWKNDQFKGYFNFNLSYRRAEKYYAMFPCLSYDELYNIEVKISSKLIIFRPKHIDTFFKLKNTSDGVYIKIQSP